MTQAYAARSTPNYGIWIAGVLAAIAIGVGAWATFGRTPKAAPQASARPVVLQRPRLATQPSKDVSGLPPATAIAAAAPTTLSSDSSGDDLLARIGDLEGQLKAERGRVEQYRQGLITLSNEYNTVVAQNQKYRDAIQQALHAPAAPAEPKKIFVSHLGQPWIVPIGWDSFSVSGEFYSAESTAQQGKATIDLYLAGVKADSTSFELNLPPHSSVPYQVTFTPRKTYMTSAAAVAAIPRWAPLQ